MNSDQIILELQAQYPNQAIIKNNEDNPTEILCEIEPTSDHPDYSIAIAVIDKIVPHFHQITEETYEVIQGVLTLTVNDQNHTLYPGDAYTIKPGEHHQARGNETWIKVTSHPGWTTNDHLGADASPR
jgi:mannose-6-phosphate isomerase-like protein (cupin superfamily)